MLQFIFSQEGREREGQTRRQQGYEVTEPQSIDIGGHDGIRDVTFGSAHIVHACHCIRYDLQSDSVSL